MAELRPYPFASLIRRTFRELETNESIHDLPARRFYRGSDRLDFSVSFHGRPASSPLGPAAGPHTQMAQNIVLSWLAGSRIMELKTVQILDELEIPRPCIDMQTIGFNAEWSQELKLEESLEEYVKGAMLVEMLRHDPRTRPVEGFDRVIYDLSVGYDLKGIRSEPVTRFLEGMMDATGIVERLRAQIPEEFAHLRQLEYPTRLADTLTLSTFHGCPPEEIESIIGYLMEEHGLHCVVKFNPTLLGSSEVDRLLHDVMEYREVRVPETAFVRDTSWDQAVAFMERLGDRAESLGLSLGAKFSNTLIVHNDRGFLPWTEEEVYLSGAPLHVLAMNLVEMFRAHFGDRFPISFAAGVDRANFPDAVALGLVPVTVCSDLLKPQGYGRMQGYYAELTRRMDDVGASNIPEFIILAYGKACEALEQAGAGRELITVCQEAVANNENLASVAGQELFERWVSVARLLNTGHYVREVTGATRYARSENNKVPKKIGSTLTLFDCVSCDKCIPVCPNDANFVFVPPVDRIPRVEAVRNGSGWTWNETGVIDLTQKHQIANFADFCNECGNCDIFCPEDGGPYIEKPRFFGTEADWRAMTDHDGFHLDPASGGGIVLGRIRGREYRLEVHGALRKATGPGFVVSYEIGNEAATLTAKGPDQIDLTEVLILDVIRAGIVDPSRVNPINATFTKD